MGFINSRSRQLVTRILPSIKTRSKKYNLSNQPRDVFSSSPGFQKSPSLLASKSCAVSAESQIEDIDIEKQLKLTGGMLDESDYTWLSSGSKSPSIVGSDGSGDVWGLESWSLSLPNRQALSLFSSDFNCKLSVEDTLNKRKIVDILYTSGSSSDVSSFDSSRYGSSCTSLSTLDDSACSNIELDMSGIWVSSLDLNLEDSELVTQNDGVETSESDFLSPSSSKGSLASDSPFSAFNSTAIFAQLETLLNSSSDMEHTEPLFWPYDNPFEVLEFDKDFLCVSPKKDVRKMENKGFSGLRSAEINLSKSMSLQASRMSTQSRLVGKSEFNRIPKKSSTRSTIIPPNNRRIQKFKLLPAQSSQCNSSSRKSTLLNLQSKKQKLELLSKKTLMELEAGNILQFFVEDMTIEKLVGLNEFDGHEGVDADFDDDLCIIV